MIILLDPIYFEKIEEEEYIFRPTPSKFIEFSPFDAKQIVYLRSLVTADNSTDKEFKKTLLSKLNGLDMGK